MLSLYIQAVGDEICQRRSGATEAAAAYVQDFGGGGGSRRAERIARFRRSNQVLVNFRGEAAPSTLPQGAHVYTPGTQKTHTTRTRHMTHNASTRYTRDYIETHVESALIQH